VALEHLIETYGYMAILVGTFLEGETVLILGGIISKLGYLELHWVMVCAFTGTFIGDQLSFFLGRYQGKRFLEKRPTWTMRVNNVRRILEQHHILIILGFRFIYGLRIVTPFVIGMSRIPIAEFLILNVIGAALWAIIIGILGYAFGHGLELVLGDIRRYEIEILAVVFLAGMLIWIIHIAYTRRQQ